MSPFDAWCDGWKSAVNEIKEELLKNPDVTSSELIEFCQDLSRQATTKAPTLEVDSPLIGSEPS